MPSVNEEISSARWAFIVVDECDDADDGKSSQSPMDGIDEVENRCCDLKWWYPPDSAFPCTEGAVNAQTRDLGNIVKATMMCFVGFLMIIQLVAIHDDSRSCELDLLSPLTLMAGATERC